MAGPALPEMSPWRRRPLTIPPDSMRSWVGLAVWEFWMGVLVCAALGFGTKLIVTAPDSIVTVFDLTNCYAAPPVAQPCERVAFKAGALSVAFNVWCGLLLIAVAAWLVEQAPGRVLRPALPESVQALSTRFAVPIPKLGRLLIVEDAWIAAAALAFRT